VIRAFSLARNAHRTLYDSGRRRKIAASQRVGSPLPHGHVRDHLLHELGRQSTHAAAPARGAEPTPFARERHDHLLRASGAAHVEAPVLQKPAAQVGPELAGHEGRHPRPRHPARGRSRDAPGGCGRGRSPRVAALIGRRGTEPRHARAVCSQGAREGIAEKDDEERTSRVSAGW
jgi:hypothetical protein